MQHWACRAARIAASSAFTCNQHRAGKLGPRREKKFEEEKKKHFQTCSSRLTLTSGHSFADHILVSPDCSVHSRAEVSRALFVWWFLYLLQNVDLILLNDPLCHVAIVLNNTWCFISVSEVPGSVLTVIRISVLCIIT